MKKYLFIVLLLILLFLISDIKISNDTSINQTINVEIRGEVENPGIYAFKRGAKFMDIVNSINLKNNADISNYSLNSTLYNNQIVTILKKDVNDNKISINSASLKELCLLPGIGENTAQKIIEYRTKYGSFNDIEELKNVNGIGDKKYEKLMEFITL